MYVPSLEANCACRSPRLSSSVCECVPGGADVFTLTGVPGDARLSRLCRRCRCGEGARSRCA
eukprot:4297430-Prymnesium_polylepis.1